MSEINESVNVSEILWTLDGTQKAIIMKEALTIIRASERADEGCGRHYVARKDMEGGQ